MNPRRPLVLALFEQYFEEHLTFNPLLATYIGDKFDLRDFHREMLCDGAVPMSVLEAKIGRWIAARK